MRLFLCALFMIDRSGSSTVLLPADKGSMVASSHQIWDPLASFSCMRYLYASTGQFSTCTYSTYSVPNASCMFQFLSESSSAVLYKKWSDEKIGALTILTKLQRGALKIGSLMLAGCIVAIVQGRLVSHGLVVLKRTRGQCSKYKYNIYNIYIYYIYKHYIYRRVFINYIYIIIIHHIL